MNTRDGSVGAALTRRRATDGDVLEVTAQPKPNDRMFVPVAGFKGIQLATDYIEYDISTAADSLRRGFYYSPIKGNANKAITINFKRGEGIDQFGREQSMAPEVQGGPCVWEHRIISLCSSAPGILPRHGIVFKGGKPGTYKVYLDNLRIRHADGSTTPIWANGKDTHSNKIADSELFTNVSVRTAAASEVHQ